MRSYYDEQTEGTQIFTGPKADEIKSIRLEFDTATKDACEDFHTALADLEKRFELINDEMDTKIRAVLADTALDGQGSSDVSFNTQLMEEHGIIIAKPRSARPSVVDVMRMIIEGDMEGLKQSGFPGGEEPFDGIRADYVPGAETKVSERWKEPA